MGYYSHHRLTLKADKGFELTDDSAVVKEFRDSCDSARYALRDTGDAMQPAKWYDCETDLAQFSKLYPMLLFVMDVLGEDGDQWQIFAKNGKSYQNKAIVTFPPFDATLLK